MKLKSIGIALFLVWAPAALSQQIVPTEDRVSILAEQIPLPGEQLQTLSDDEKDIIRGLEQIENDPAVRAQAAGEAKVPLSVF